MLSINIPVYNVVVGKLVAQVKAQAEMLACSYEINVYDDQSEEWFKQQNAGLRKIEKVNYTELDENIGRAAIRNLMGRKSRYENLLFIDADSLLVNNNYLKTYINTVSNDLVLCGGTVYSESAPEDQSQILRWTYGHEREAISANVRNGNKGFILTSNNFLIRKSVFEKVNFREELKAYGHEDTVLGFDLFNGGYNIRHIDNPVKHVGLESAADFLEKTRQGLQNLCFILEKVVNNNEVFIQQFYFLRRYYQICNFIPSRWLKWIFNRFKPYWEQNLCGTKPSLLYFDLYRLTYFATIKNR